MSNPINRVPESEVYSKLAWMVQWSVLAWQNCVTLNLCIVDVLNMFKIIFHLTSNQTLTKKHPKLESSNQVLGHILDMQRDMPI